MQAPTSRSLGPFLGVLLAIGVFTPSGRSIAKAADASQSAAKPKASAAGESDHPNAAPAGGPVQKTSDACALLSKSVIETVQGEPVKETKGSQEKAGSVITAQCFYALPTFANSISLTLTLPDPANSSHYGPRDFWQKQFHGAAESGEEPADNKEKSASREEKEKGIPPVAVSGLGEEAYWIRSFVGTLYVLKGNAFLRISIGGKQDDSARLQKAQILARDALQRMP